MAGCRVPHSCEAMSGNGSQTPGVLSSTNLGREALFRPLAENQASIRSAEAE